MTAWLTALVASLLKILLPRVAKKSRPTAEDADSDHRTRETLRAKVRKHWLLIAVLIPIVAPGCRVRTVYVPHGTPVRLRETVEDVRVWVKDAHGETVPGRMDLYEGWYALPLEEEE